MNSVVQSNCRVCKKPSENAPQVTLSGRPVGICRGCHNAARRASYHRNKKPVVRNLFKLADKNLELISRLNMGAFELIYRHSNEPGGALVMKKNTVFISINESMWEWEMDFPAICKFLATRGLIITEYPTVLVDNFQQTIEIEKLKLSKISNSEKVFKFKAWVD